MPSPIPTLHSTWLFLLLSLIGLSCENHIVFSRYLPIRNAVWQENDTLKFTFYSPDTLTPYNLSIHFRTDNSFSLDTLLIHTKVAYPSGKIIEDTLQYTTTKPKRNGLGYGLASLTENKLPFRKKIVFPHSGAYRVSLHYAIPQHSVATHLQHLKGVIDVGLQIEKSSP